MRRALETAKIMFLGHPSQPQLIVHPILTERINNSNDLSCWEGVPYEGYEAFDWSLMPPHYFPFDLVDNEHFREAKGRPTRVVFEILMSKAASIYPAKIESKQEALVRVNKGKEIWREELEKATGNVALVAHSFYFRLFTLKDTPEGSTFKSMLNCEVYKVEDRGF
jgi:broad specificity phosphatase PhoE